MARFIARVLGARGRTLSIYDTKCVISTTVTPGSILAGNATDGEKTIFYVDCVGIQFKEAGRTLGFLQLETASMQMNNQTSNVSSENSFTFEDVPGSTNAVMQIVYAAVCDLVETVKYCPPVKVEQLWDIVLKLAEADLIVDAHLRFDARDNEKLQQEREVQEAEEKRRQAEIEVQTRMDEIGKQLAELDGIRDRLEGIQSCKRVQDVMKLWRAAQWEDLSEEKKAQIQAFLDEWDNRERLYGSNGQRTQEVILGLLAGIKASRYPKALPVPAEPFPVPGPSPCEERCGSPL